MTDDRVMLQFDGIEIDAAEQLREIERWDCEQSLMTFVQHAWPHMDPASFQTNWHLEDLAMHLEAVADGAITRLIINVPPRSSKTSIASICFPAWVWAQRTKGPNSGPHVSFMYVSYNESLSMEHNVACRRLIKSEWYQSLWGDRFELLDDSDTKSAFMNNKGGRRFITSIGSRVTGKGADCLVGDTLVSTPNGPKKIKDISVGDAVFGFDNLRGEVVTRLVQATRRVPARNLYEVSLPQGNTVRCSGNHPFFVAGRGYVAAENLGRGDRLCVIHPEQKSQRQDHVLDAVLDVPQSVPEADVRTAEGFEKEFGGHVLFSQLQRSASCGEEHHEAVRERVWENGTSRDVLLLSGVREGKDCQAHGRAAAFDLRVLQDGILLGERKAEVLLRHLPERAALGEYQGLEESEVPEGRGCALWSFLRATSANDIGEGRARLRDMRMVRAEEGPVEWPSGRSATCPSYRLGAEQQLSRESDNALRVMPSDRPFVSEVSEVHVEKYGGREDWMYDIQVEGTNNFFADGILVHNCIILDDPNATNDAESEAVLKTTNDYYDNTLKSRLNNKKTGSIICIQQRVAEQDLSGHLLEKYSGEWNHFMVPLEYDWTRAFPTDIGWCDPRGCDDEGNPLAVPVDGVMTPVSPEAAKELAKRQGELLWPERFDEDFVKAERRNPWSYASQYQQVPAPKGGGIVKSEWWQCWDSPQYPIFEFVLASLDTAYGAKQTADRSAMTVWGVFSEDIVNRSERYMDHEGRIVDGNIGPNVFSPKVMMCYAWAENLQFHELIQKTIETCRKYKVDKLLIENKANGISIAQELKRAYRNERFSVQLINPGLQDKVARLHSVVPIFANELVYAPDKQWAQMVIDQVSNFPKGRFKDAVDATSQALRHLRDMGMLESRPEVEYDLNVAMQHGGNVDTRLYPV